MADQKVLQRLKTASMETFLKAEAARLTFFERMKKIVTGPLLKGVATGLAVAVFFAMVSAIILNPEAMIGLLVLGTTMWDRIKKPIMDLLQMGKDAYEFISKNFPEVEKKVSKFLERMKKSIIESPLKMGIAIGVGIGCCLAAVGAVLLNPPAAIGLFVVGVIAGVFGGGWAHLRELSRKVLQPNTRQSAPLSEEAASGLKRDLTTTSPDVAPSTMGLEKPKTKRKRPE